MTGLVRLVGNLVVLVVLAFFCVIVCGAVGSTVTIGGAIVVLAYGVLAWLLGVLAPFGDPFGLAGRP